MVYKITIRCFIVILMSLCQTAFGQNNLTIYLKSRVALSLSTGYSSEDMAWSIAGNIRGQNPNIYSELKWTEQKGPCAGLGLHYIFYKNVFIDANFNIKNISGGYVTDTDYSEDDRNGQTFYTKLNTQKGSTGAGIIAIGYQFSIWTKLTVGLAGGYTSARQNLYLQDNDSNGQGVLNSSYKTQWQGGVLKLLPVVALSYKVKLAGSLAFSQVRYKAKANWNLIPEFEHPVSFRHKANGYGVEGGISMVYYLCKTTAFNIRGQYFNRATGNGTDEVYLINGNRRVTQFNGANSKGYGISVGAVLFW